MARKPVLLVVGSEGSPIDPGQLPFAAEIISVEEYERQIKALDETPPKDPPPPPPQRPVPPPFVFPMTRVSEMDPAELLAAIEPEATVKIDVAPGEEALLPRIAPLVESDLLARHDVTFAIDLSGRGIDV